MKAPVSSRFLAVGLAMLSLANPVLAQGPFPAGAPPVKEEKDTRPPIPPGVPTTPDNVHCPTEGEARLGREGSAEVEKQYKVLASGPHQERLQRVASVVVKAIQRDDIVRWYKRQYKLPRAEDRSRRVPFEYSFKVLDVDKEINAFSLAGGPIYVTTGLLNHAGSDDELAAVLAHECAHVAFHHVEQLVKKQKKLNSAQLWGLLATVIAGAAGGGALAGAASNLLTGAQLVQIATLTGYGRELEHEADKVGVHALASTPYHPAGMLTFMKKLAYQDRLRGNRDYGIFQSHPYSNERAERIRKEVVGLGYKVDVGVERLVSRSFRFETATRRENGRELADLRLNGSVVFTAAAGEENLTPTERVQKIARQMEELFAQSLTFDDVRQSADKEMLMLRGIPVLRVYSLDAAEMGSAAAVTDRAYKALMRALWQEKLETRN